MDLYNETAVNVVALLKARLGTSRSYTLRLDAFPLDSDLTARDVEGQVKLTKITDEVMASLAVKGTVELLCLRCLREFDQEVEAAFDEEFRIAHDVRTGNGIAPLDPDDERLTIDENHELDFGEALRQEIIVALPMRPTCGDDCPGPDLTEVGEPDEPDNRFAALADLLDDEQPT